MKLIYETLGVEWELGLGFKFACGPAFKMNLGFDFNESEVVFDVNAKQLSLLFG
jgi:hypothetical protein